MIEIENDLLTEITLTLRDRFSGINVYSRLTLEPPSFPCVCFEEADNAVYRKTQDSGSLENHVELLYEVNVMSGKSTGAKSECNAIFAVIDGIMESRGFIRIGKSPVAENAPIICRIAGRYRGIVSKDRTVYTR